MSAFYRQADELLLEPSMKRIFELTGQNDNTLFCERRRSDGSVERISYDAMKARAVSAGAAIRRALASPRGAVVGLKLKNCPDWAALFWGLLMAGYVPLLLDAGEGSLSTAALLRECAARALIAHDKPLYGDIPVLSPDALLSCTDAAGFEPCWADSVAFCSSGTSRRTVCVFDGNALANQINAARSMPAVSKTIMYPMSEGPLKVAALLPFHHVFGFVAVLLWYSFFGRTLVFFDDLAADRVRSDCRELGVTHIFCIPMLWDGILEYFTRAAKSAESALERRVARRLVSGSPDALSACLARRRLFGSRVRCCITGGAPVSPRTLAFINGIGYPLHNGYGLTEAGITSVELSPVAARRLDGAAGAPLFGVKYTVVNGELTIESPYLHIGTYENGAFVQRSHGAQFTGDAAELDRDGRLRITGRLKEMIIGPAGENIRPDELEGLLYPVPHAARFAVLGLDDGKGGEKTVLAVELDVPLTGDSLAAIRRHVNAVNASLPAYKRIREIHVPPVGIPMTNTHKLRRRELRETLEGSRHAAIPLSPPMDNFEGLLASTTDATRAEVRALFARALNARAEDIRDDDDFIFDLSGDSFTYVMLVDLFERRFGLVLPPQLYTRFTTVNDFAALADNRDALKRLTGEAEAGNGDFESETVKEKDYEETQGL